MSSAALSENEEEDEMYDDYDPTAPYHKQALEGGGHAEENVECSICCQPCDAEKEDLLALARWRPRRLGRTGAAAAARHGFCRCKQGAPPRVDGLFALQARSARRRPAASNCTT